MKTSTCKHRIQECFYTVKDTAAAATDLQWSPLAEKDTLLIGGLKQE